MVPHIEDHMLPLVITTRVKAIEHPEQQNFDPTTTVFASSERLVILSSISAQLNTQNNKISIPRQQSLQAPNDWCFSYRHLTN